MIQHSFLIEIIKYLNLNHLNTILFGLDLIHFIE
jgi:hypothetical protein